jgi:hypothetical protein
MGQGIREGKPRLPATAHGDRNTFSGRRGRTRTARYLAGGGCAGWAGAPTDADSAQCANR